MMKEEVKLMKNGRQIVNCEVCGRSYEGAYRLGVHMRTHTGERPYSCEICGRQFSVIADCRRHTERVHSDNKPHNCEKCGKSYKYICDYKRHMRKHSELNACSCEVCGQSFSSLPGLNRHMARHTVEGRYNCYSCGESFSNGYSLGQHLRTEHSLTNLCPICDKSVKSTSALFRHIRSHTGERPHVCLECGKAFSQAGGLSRHMLTHTRQGGTSSGNSGKSSDAVTQTPWPEECQSDDELVYGEAREKNFCSNNNVPPGNADKNESKSLKSSATEEDINALGLIQGQERHHQYNVYRRTVNKKSSLLVNKHGIKRQKIDRCDNSDKTVPSSSSLNRHITSQLEKKTDNGRTDSDKTASDQTDSGGTDS